MLNTLQYLLKSQQRQDLSESPQTESGFTMIELIVGAVMAFLVITPLLGFVVTVLQDDTREQTKASTEYELQAAADFIAEDLSQAYYIYTKNEIDNEINGQLPDNGEPVLVFWKYHRMPDSVPAKIGGSVTPITCTPDECDDSSVRALVSYHLVTGSQGEIWCQPDSATQNCPKRIVRYLIHDGLEKYRGTGVLYPPGDLKDSQKISDAFNPNFSLDTPYENLTAGSFENPDVLVNYVEEFEIDDDDPNQGSDVVKFIIQGNALRRIKSDAESCEDNDSAYCPTVTLKVQGLPIEVQ